MSDYQEKYPDSYAQGQCSMQEWLSDRERNEAEIEAQREEARQAIQGYEIHLRLLPIGHEDRSIHELGIAYQEGILKALER
jgi:hypothetical protein